MSGKVTECTNTIQRFRAQLMEDGTGFDSRLDRQEGNLTRFAFYFRDDLLGYLTVTPDPPGDHVLLRATTPDCGLTVEGTDYLPTVAILERDEHGKFKRLLRWLSEDLELAGPPTAVTRARRGGPTVKTEERARAIERIVGQHPDWTQLQVALQASKELSDVNMDSAQTVRNVLRAMGWDWSAMHVTGKDR